MADDMYRARMPSDPALVPHNVRLMLMPQDWDAVEKVMARREWTRSRTLSHFVTMYCQLIREQAANRTAERFAADKARNGDDSWVIKE